MIGVFDCFFEGVVIGTRCFVEFFKSEGVFVVSIPDWDVVVSHVVFIIEEEFLQTCPGDVCESYFYFF